MIVNTASISLDHQRGAFARIFLARGIQTKTHAAVKELRTAGSKKMLGIDIGPSILRLWRFCNNSVWQKKENVSEIVVCET